VRVGADWEWVNHALKRSLAAFELPFEGWTSLAAGADQAFANAVLDCGGALVAVIPIAGYEKFFPTDLDLREYLRLLDASARTIRLDNPNPALAFLNAGKRIVDECTTIIAIWDGGPSRGPGGTADIVRYARELGRSVIVLDPLTRSATGP